MKKNHKVSKKKKVGQYAASFLVLNLALEPLTGLSLLRPQIVMAEDDITTESETAYLISSNKEVSASSVNGDSQAGYAFDGNEKTRWESSWGKGDEGTADIQEWIMVDLGKESSITKIHLNWENACASKYQIQTSNDGQKWQDIQNVENGEAGKKDFDFSNEDIKARYVRVFCTEKAMKAYGVSLFEFQVYGFNGLYKVNLAQGKQAQASSTLDAWWMYDDQGNIRPGEEPDASNAIDGNLATKWRSTESNDGFQENTGQWVSVDLEKTYNIGEVDITWDNDAAATVYDIQTSTDGVNWQTVYRTLQGDSKKQKIKLTAPARYVRLFCYSRYRQSYVAVQELEVYRQMEDDETVTHEIPDLPTKEVVSVGGKATYNSQDIFFANQARYPEYIEEDLRDQPLASNDWWQSIVITETGNALSLLPLKVKYEPLKGLGMLTFTKQVWDKKDDYTQGAVTGTVSEETMDFYVKPSDLDESKVYNKVSGYGDYHVSVNLYDANGLSMSNTFVKGSPYTYFDFGTKKEIELNLNDSVTAVEFFNDQGAILEKENDQLTTDHIGIKITNNEEKVGEKTSYYCLNLPENTIFERTSQGIKITVKDDQSYMSVGTMTDKNQLDQFYQHGYAFVTDTKVTYSFNEDTSVVTSNYTLTTESKRSGFDNSSYQCLYPHQWDKYASQNSLSDITYQSPRGDLRLFDGNSFSISDTFYGMVPEFTAPTNSEYDEDELMDYLKKLDQSTSGNLIGSDAYWQGKSLHPLGLGVLVADQLGNIEYRDKFLQRMKTILSDWFTYSGSDDQAFFFYDKNWGTLYYKDSEFGANKDISDHHFTYGYFLFASSVLATYDDEFYQDYKDMIDLLARDFGSPYDNDDMFCKFRSFDPYEGHSWAGGYADNDAGNNQEAGSESLFGWVGMYLWSTKSENKDLRDASIFGFTTEINAIKHYWFNYYGSQDDGYDHSGWPEDWPSESIGQVYGSTYFYGTFFGGYPTYVYGIHMLPVTEYISYYGMETDEAARVYQGIIKDTNGQKEAHPEVSDYPDTDNSWQHIFVPFHSLSDVDTALSEINSETQSQTEGFNTYWFANNIKDLGQRSSEIYATGGVSASVYEKTEDGKTQYQAMVWNPTNHSIDVTFKNNAGEVVGNATIAAQSLVRLDPTLKDAIQVEKPEFSIESGTYDDTQYVKISTDTQDAIIHYTTDGSTPTAQSPVYDGRIVVSDTTTIKAIAVKDNCIDSSMSSVAIEIESGCMTTGPNIARGKDVTASSSKGDNVAKYATDYNAKTRWEAENKYEEWIYVDLADTYMVNKVKLSWETAYADQYEIQVSTDAQSWETVDKVTKGDGGFDELVFDPVEAQYVRIKCNHPGSDYTYSLYEIGVYEARKISTPQLSLASGEYEGNQFLSIASGTKGVEIHYTTDGSEPTEESPLYIPGLTLFEDTHIKAKAFKKGMIASDTVEGTYTIKNGLDVGDVDNYDNAPYFEVEADDDIIEELLAGEGGETDRNELIDGNLAYGKKVVVSSSENEGTKDNVIDGNLDTTWSSNFKTEEVADPDKEWCYIDLGSNVDFNQVKIHWVENTTPGNQYTIDVSDDGEHWETVYLYSRKENNSDDATDVCNFDVVNARYVRMQGIDRGQGWGYAIREIKVRNSQDIQPFGENVAPNGMPTAENIEDFKWINDESLDTAALINNGGSYQLDLAKTYTIDRISLNYGSDFEGSYTVQYSLDGENWETIQVVNDPNTKDEITFEAIDARFIKIDFTTQDTASLQELEVYTVGSSADAPENIVTYQAVGAYASTQPQAASNAIDGNKESRWESATTDDEWIYIDLGAKKDVNQIDILWEAAYAKGYEIQISDTANDDWQTVYQTTDGQGGHETINIDTVQTQFIRMKGTERATNYGYSIFEMSASYKQPIALENILVGPETNKVPLKDKLQLQYAFYPANADDKNITFKSSDPSIATVDENGLVTTKKLGVVTIIAMANVSGQDVTSSVTVQVTGQLTAPKIRATLMDDNQVSLTWNAIDLAASYDVYYSTKQSGEYNKLNDSPIEDTQYTISDLEPGKYYFKVVARAPGDQDYYDDSSLSAASSPITIKSNEPTLSLQQTSGTIGVGSEPITIPITVSPSDTPVTWSSSNTTIATVDNGQVTPHQPGQVVITATAGQTSVTYTLTVQKKLAAPEIKHVVNGNNVTITWDAIDDATYYDVYRQMNDGDYQLIATVKDATEYMNQNLTEGNYNYKVIAKNDNANIYLDSNESNIEQVTIKKQLDKVEPTLTIDKNNIKITWSSVSNASKYQILRQNEDGQYEILADVDGTEYTDDNLAIGTYRYIVVAVGEGLYETSPQSQPVVGEIKGEQLAQVSLPSLEQEDHKITITWNEVENADSYDVLRQEGDGEYKVIANVKETTFSEELTTGGYKYRIVAKGTGIYLDSLRSDAVNVIIQEQLATPVVKAEVQKNSVILTWNEIANASNYQILRLDTDGEYKPIQTVTETTYTDQNLAAGDYSYKVIALGNDIYTQSPESQSVLATVQNEDVKDDDNSSLPDHDKDQSDQKGNGEQNQVQSDKKDIKTNQKNGTNVKTGDTTSYFALITMCLSLISFIFLSIKKKIKN